MKRRILVTDGEERAALALVRAFGRAGHEVWVGSRARSLASASRYATGWVPLPNPLENGPAYLEAVVEGIARIRADTLVPLSEAALSTLLPARHELAGVLFPFADFEAFRHLTDKAAVLAAAPSAGIAAPKQVELTSPAVGREALETLRFPVVIKPSRSVAGSGATKIKLGVEHAATPSVLAERLAALPDVAYPVLIQERIVGPGIGVFLLVWNGELRAAFAHQRIREKPPSGGVSVYRESVALDPHLLRQCLALLQAFDWRGVAMVELKLDAATGTPYLMEINGRFWGSLQLAIDAGVDFPNLLLAAAAGEPAPPVTSWRLGVRSRWWWGDVDHLIAMFRSSPEALGLPPGAPGRWRSLAAFLRLWWPGDRSEVERLTDPGPFFRESSTWLGALLRRGSRSA